MSATAWMYEHEVTAQTIFERVRQNDVYHSVHGWEETPLYVADQLATNRSVARKMVAGDIGAEPFNQPLDIARAIFLIKAGMGDANRGEFHRGWHEASRMALAMLERLAREQ